MTDFHEATMPHTPDTVTRMVSGGDPHAKDYEATSKMFSSLKPDDLSWLSFRQYWREPSEQLPVKPAQFPRPAAASSSTDLLCHRLECAVEMLQKQPAKKPSCFRVKQWKSRSRYYNQRYHLLLVLFLVFGFALYSFLFFFGEKIVNEAGSGDNIAARIPDYLHPKRAGTAA